MVRGVAARPRRGVAGAARCPRRAGSDAWAANALLVGSCHRSLARSPLSLVESTPIRSFSSRDIRAGHATSTLQPARLFDATLGAVGYSMVCGYRPSRLRHLRQHGVHAVVSYLGAYRSALVWRRCAGG